jgi:hypothetical protein
MAKEAGTDPTGRGKVNFCAISIQPVWQTWTQHHELRIKTFSVGCTPRIQEQTCHSESPGPNFLTSRQAFKLTTPPIVAQGHIGDTGPIKTEVAHTIGTSHQDVQTHSKNRKPTVMMSMSHHFKLLNCISPRKAQGKEVKPWVMNCHIQGLMKECIIDTGCNITAIPLCLTQKLKLHTLPAPHLVVTIADGSTYNPIGMVDIDIEVVGVHTIMRALVSTGDKVLLGLDWMEEVGCTLDILARCLIMTREHTQVFVQLQTVTMKAEIVNLQVSEPRKPTGPQGPQF